MLRLGEPWQVRVVPNLYPAVDRQEVVVHVPRHARSLAELGDEENPVALAWGRGIPEAVSRTMIPARYNAMDVLRRIFERDGDDIAAIIIEPVLGNAQAIMPQPGFHEAIRALTKEFGAVLIYDEVKTGFRFARGGAAEFFGVTPDLATFAKAMGNGYPAAAFGGSEEVMSVLPDHVSHGGTYAGNRVAAAAAVKTLTILKETDALEKIHATGRRVQGEPAAKEVVVVGTADRGVEAAAGVPGRGL